MGTTSAAAKRRMHKKENRDQIAESVRRGLKPRTAFGLLPAQAKRLSRLLAKQDIDLLHFVPHPVSMRRNAWSISATAADVGAEDRFLKCLHRVGLRAAGFNIHAILKGAGWWIDCIAVFKPMWFGGRR